MEGVEKEKRKRVERERRGGCVAEEEDGMEGCVAKDGGKGWREGMVLVRIGRDAPGIVVNKPGCKETP